MSAHESLQDFFIKIDGIAGESKDSNHKGQIDVLNWGYAVTQSSSANTGGGGGVGDVVGWCREYIGATCGVEEVTRRPTYGSGCCGGDINAFSNTDGGVVG